MKLTQISSTADIDLMSDPYDTWEAFDGANQLEESTVRREQRATSCNEIQEEEGS
jgi:hypothetical protein